VDLKKRKRNPAALEARQATVIQTQIPAYATACTNLAEYTSACSCIGATGTTTFAPTPTSTSTVTVTTTETPGPTLTAIQYAGEYTCAPQASGDTPTEFPLNECVITEVSNSINFGTFTGGACTPAECSIQAYGDFYCADGVIGTYPVTDSDCLDADSIYALMLVCPSCPSP
jgi:hypothetical protein